MYPLLKNKEEWTYPSAEFCSAWTKQHPNTCLLDSKRNHSCIQPRSYAVSPSPSSSPTPSMRKGHTYRRGWAQDYIASYLHVSLRLVAVINVAIVTALPSYLILYIIPDDSTTYWKIPAAGAYNWVAFDLGSEYTITGVRISGWYVGQVTTLRLVTVLCPGLCPSFYDTVILIVGMISRWFISSLLRQHQPSGISTLEKTLILM